MKKEFEFINWIHHQINDQQSNLIAGIGDDAAIFLPQNDQEILISTDLLAEDIHFKLDYTPARLLGHKALAVNLSDIAAMGGVPTFFLLSIARPKTLSDEFISEMLLSMLQLANQHQTTLIGGDTSASANKLFLNITILGNCPRGKSIKRTGAKPNDEIYVTGQLGGSNLGFKLLQAGKRILNPELTKEETLALMAHLQPQPRLAIAQSLCVEEIANSMIDISDGVSSDLGHICEQSNVGARVEAKSLPLFPGASLDQALNGGEDYELIFTVSPSNIDKLKALMERFPNLAVTKIGTITENLERLLITDSTSIPLLARGYDHFA